VKSLLKWEINTRELYSACDDRGAAKEIKMSWKRRNPLYQFLGMEDERIERLRWKQKHIKVSICLLVLAIICLALSLYLYDFNNNGLSNWWSNVLMSLSTGLFAGWTLYVLTNIRMNSESDIDQRLVDVEILYNLGKKVYDINAAYITYYVMPVEMRKEWNHNKEFASAFIAAYEFVDNMPKLGNRKILKTKFDLDYDEVKEKLEKMSAEITYELTYKDARKYLKEIINLIESSYALVEIYKRDCEAEKNIIRKVPF